MRRDPLRGVVWLDGWAVIAELLRSMMPPLDPPATRLENTVAWAVVVFLSVWLLVTLALLGAVLFWAMTR